MSAEDRAMSLYKLLRTLAFLSICGLLIGGAVLSASVLSASVMIDGFASETMLYYGTLIVCCSLLLLVLCLQVIVAMDNKKVVE